MRWLMPLLLFAACLAAMSCRSPKTVSAPHLSAPLPAPLSTPPAMAGATLNHDGKSSSNSFQAVSANSMIQTSNYIELSSKTTSGQQQEAPAKVTAAQSPAAAAPLNQQLALPDASVAIQSQAAGRTYSLAGAASAKPSPSAVPFPGGSTIPIAGSESGTAGDAISIGLWGHLISAPPGAASAAPPRLPDNPMSNEQPANRALSLPDAGEGSAPGGAAGGKSAEAIAIMDPLLKDNFNDERRREEEMRQQENKRKARETERENLNRVFYQFLLGK